MPPRHLCGSHFLLFPIAHREERGPARVEMGSTLPMGPFRRLPTMISASPITQPLIPKISPHPILIIDGSWSDRQAENLALSNENVPVIGSACCFEEKRVDYQDRNPDGRTGKSGQPQR